jgi:hypothetical protein
VRHPFFFLEWSRRSSRRHPTETAFLEFDLPALLSELARGTESGSQAIGTAATCDPVPFANFSTLNHLQDPSEGPMVRQAEDDAIARNDIATGAGIGGTVGDEMLVSAFVLCVYYARAEPRKDAGRSIGAAITEAVAPFSPISLHRQVVCIPVPTTCTN